MDKTIRFAELVKSSGKPAVATLWGDPKRDSTFAKAIRENRVLTVKQETVGNKTDFGEVGFKKDKNVSYFVFPESLPESSTGRVVGIKYDLLEQPKVADPIPAARTRAETLKRKRKSVPSAKPKPELRQFIFTVRKTAVWETTVKVKATSKSVAENEAIASLKKAVMPLSEAVVKIEAR